MVLWQNTSNIWWILWCFSSNNKTDRYRYQQVYYELVKWRQDKKVDNIAIVTLEQIAPFPFERVQELATKYSKAEMVWVQEEPQNMGAWAFVEPRFATALLSVNQQRIRCRHSLCLVVCVLPSVCCSECVAVSCSVLTIVCQAGAQQKDIPKSHLASQLTMSGASNFSWHADVCEWGIV